MALGSSERFACILPRASRGCMSVGRASVQLSALLMSIQRKLGHLANNGQRILTAIGGSFLKIPLVLRHLIGDIGETENGILLDFRERIESRRFHFDRE